jgi:hypothetical protein
MDWLVNILNNENSWKSFIFFFITLITLIILVKKGIISFKGKGLTVGNDEVERTIIRNQIQYAQTAVGDFYHNIPYWNGRDEYRLRYIMELIIDCFVECAIFNHITNEKIYTELKQRKVWQCVIDHAENPNILTDDFKKKVYEETENILKKFIDIREYHKQ